MFRNTLIALLFFSTIACAQNFKAQTERHRQEYKKEFLNSEKSPLKKQDLKYLRFYDPDSTYRVEAKFEKVRGEPFEMPTYSGVNKTYTRYGILRFRINGKKQTLTIYRSLSLQTVEKYRNYLFIPFKDKTNADETYGGGRYLDLQTTDIKNGSYILDFNKAYNPYCAYATGFNCPIPPVANHLTIPIEAGEKKFARPEEAEARVIGQ